MNFIIVFLQDLMRLHFFSNIQKQEVQVLYSEQAKKSGTLDKSTHIKLIKLFFECFIYQLKFSQIEKEIFVKAIENLKFFEQEASSTSEQLPLNFTNVFARKLKRHFKRKF